MPKGNKLDAEYAIVSGEWTTTPTAISFDSSAENGTALAAGTYLMCATEPCYFIQGATGQTATSSHHYLPANTFVRLTVSAAANAYVAAIKVSSAGVLKISKQ